MMKVPSSFACLMQPVCSATFPIATAGLPDRYQAYPFCLGEDGQCLPSCMRGHTLCHNMQGLTLAASMDHTGNLSGRRSTRSMWIGAQTPELTHKQNAGGAWLSCAPARLPQITESRTLPEEDISSWHATDG